MYIHTINNQYVNQKKKNFINLLFFLQSKNIMDFYNESKRDFLKRTAPDVYSEFEKEKNKKTKTKTTTTKTTMLPTKCSRFLFLGESSKYFPKLQLQKGNTISFPTHPTYYIKPSILSPTQQIKQHKIYFLTKHTHYFTTCLLTSLYNFYNRSKIPISLPNPTIISPFPHSLKCKRISYSMPYS